MVAPAPIVSNSNRDDPNNYVSFDDFVANSTLVYSLQSKVADWNAAHPDMPVKGYGDAYVPPAGPNTDAFEQIDGSGLTRAFAVVQLVGAGMELLVGAGAVFTPEPTGATKVLGAVVLLHGLDSAQAALRTLVSGDRTSTFTQQGAAGAASFAGASPSTAETIGVVTDVGVGVAGSFGVGALSKAGPKGVQLVHLTNAKAADTIRASATLGLGRSTVYAGPEVLSKTTGWSMIWRTGRQASQMTETILLPAKANESFLVVQPMGPFSMWQRLNGTVFSASAGTFNIETGAFTRTGPGVHQFVIYTIDSAVMATLRGTPGIIDTARK